MTCARIFFIITGATESSLLSTRMYTHSYSIRRKKIGRGGKKNGYGIVTLTVELLRVVH